MSKQAGVWAVAVGILLGLLIWRWPSEAPARTTRVAVNEGDVQVLAGDDENISPHDLALMEMARDLGELGDLTLTKSLIPKLPQSVADEALEWNVVALLPKPDELEPDGIPKLKESFPGNAAIVVAQVLPELQTAPAKLRILTKLLLRMHSYGLDAFDVGTQHITREDLTRQAGAVSQQLASAAATTPAKSWWSGSYFVGVITALLFSLSQLVKSFIDSVAKAVGNSLADSMKRLWPAATVPTPHGLAGSSAPKV